jgi:hypothetical protein
VVAYHLKRALNIIDKFSAQDLVQVIYLIRSRINRIQELNEQHVGDNSLDQAT